MCTFSVDPQQGAGHFPTLENAALSKPFRGAFVTGVVRSVEIYEWIRRRQPFFKVLAQLVPCKHLSLNIQRQCSSEITNACHRSHL